MISAEEVLIVVNSAHSQGYEAINFPRPDDILRYKYFEKISVDVESLKIDSRLWQPIVDHYADEATDFPAIVIDENNRVIDGAQRVAGAKKRGDKIIAAYRPIY